MKHFAEQKQPNLSELQSGAENWLSGERGAGGGERGAGLLASTNVMHVRCADVNTDENLSITSKPQNDDSKLCKLFAPVLPFSQYG